MDIFTPAYILAWTFSAGILISIASLLRDMLTFKQEKTDNYLQGYIDACKGIEKQALVEHKDKSRSIILLPFKLNEGDSLIKILDK